MAQPLLYAMRPMNSDLSQSHNCHKLRIQMRFAAMIIVALLSLFSSTAYAEIIGFTVNSIEGLDSLSLNSRFGTSPSDLDHKVNYEDCLQYNGENIGDTTNSVSGALESDTDAGSTVQDSIPSDVVVDIIEANEEEEEAENQNTEEETSSEEESSEESTVDLPSAEYVRFDVGMPSQLGINWYYTVRIGNCDANASLGAAETDSCTYIRQKSELTSFSSISFDVNVRYLIGTKSLEDGAEKYCADLKGTSDDASIIIAIEQDGSSLTLQSQEIQIDYDYDSPSAPTEVSAEPGEQNVDISWSDELNSTESDVSYRVYYAESSFEADDLDNVYQTSTTSGTSIEVDDLELGTTYYFRVVTLDSFSNISSPSEQVSASPVAVNDFFEEYARKGGREEGGFCATSSTPVSPDTLILVLMLMLLVALLRQNKQTAGRSSGASKLLTVLLAGTFAMAVPNTSEASRESPRIGTANFRFGTYVPEIDSEFSDGLTTPFADIYGDGKLWLFRAEAGYLIFDKFGSIFLTTEVGYGSIDGSGIESATGEFSNDETSMHFLPISVNLIYQFDILARKMSFPLIPYARFGYDYWIWWITDGAGDVADRSSLNDAPACEALPCAPSPDYEVISDGMGATQGYHVGGGIRLMLDPFASKMAKDFDNEMGFNDSYLFAEMTVLDLDDFGSDKSFILSDSMFSFGLGFDF